MKFVPVLFLLICSVCSYAQKKIKLEEVTQHVGDSVQVRGQVYGVRYLENAKNTPTFINLGAAYPNQLLTVVIWGDVRSKLAYKPEEALAKGFVTVVGKIELFKDKPQIVVRNPDQLLILRDEEVPADKIPPIQKKKDN